MTEPNKQPFQIILPAFLNLAALDVYVINDDFLAPNHPLQIKTE